MKKLQVPVSDADHIQGSSSAAITLIEYGDFQCPDCGRAYPMIKKLQQRYAEKLRLVYRNFPLEQIHELAEPASEAAEYAAANGKFWEMHDAIFEHQRRLSLDTLSRLAGEVGLDQAAASAAIEEGKYSEKIEADVSGGVDAGVHGTPTFFINEEPYAGQWTLSELAEAIDAALQASAR